MGAAVRGSAAGSGGEAQAELRKTHPRRKQVHLLLYNIMNFIMNG
jgi:hypothetical protein